MKLTAGILKRIVNEEMRRLGESSFGKARDPESVEAEEVDADELADSLENKIDHAKALKMEEARLSRRLHAVREQRARLVRSVQGRFARRRS